MDQQPHSSQEQPRALAGVPGAGRWIADPRPDDTNVGLRLEPVGWDEIPPDPTEDQMTRAADAARRVISWNGYTLTRAEINAKTDEFARTLAEQEAAFEAWKVRATHPDDEMYDNIWAGLAVGTSEEMVKATLDVLNYRYDQIEREGNSDPEELRIMDNEFAMYELALACGGRNLSINQANVVANRRVRDRVPF